MNLPSTSPRGARMVLLALWQIATTGARGLVWESVRESAIDLRPLSWPLRLLTATGMAAVIALLASTLFSDVLRQSGPLVPLAEVVGERGLMAPWLAVPLTWVGVTLAWGYLLVGAHYLRWPARTLILMLYLFFYVVPIVLGLAGTVGSAWFRLLGAGGALLMLLALLQFVPQGRLPLPLAWVGVMTLHAAPALLLLSGMIVPEVASWTARLASTMVLSALVLVTPFLFIAGMEWVTFAREVSGWLAEGVREHANRLMAIGLLLALLAFRLVARGMELAGGDVAAWGGGYAGAALFVAGLVAIGAWRRRAGPDSELPGRLLVSLVVLMLLPQIILFLSLQIVAVLLAPVAVLTNDTTRFNETLLLISRLSALEPPVRDLLTSGVALLVALWALRKRRPSVVAYALILAWWRLLHWLTDAGRPLAALRFGYDEVDGWLLVALAGVALFWLARGALTKGRAVALLALAALAAVLNQTDFLDNPFSPLFGFAGLFFLVFSILWNALTAGTFANQETPALPRTARLLLYVGYALLSVLLAHWVVVIHNIPLQVSQAAYNFGGFVIFGLPLAFLWVVEYGMERRPEADVGSPSPVARSP